MAKYALQIKQSAQRELDALDDALFSKNQWRVRAGDWRIVYIIDDAAKVISVTRIAHRREVYE